MAIGEVVLRWRRDLRLKSAMGWAAANSSGKVLQMYFIAIAEQASAFENVAQFAHIARIVVAAQPGGRLR